MEGSCPVCRSHRSRSPRRELIYVVRACACVFVRVRVCPQVFACVRMCSQNGQNKSKQTKLDVVHASLPISSM